MTSACSQQTATAHTQAKCACSQQTATVHTRARCACSQQTASVHTRARCACSQQTATVHTRASCIQFTPSRHIALVLLDRRNRFRRANMYTVIPLSALRVADGSVLAVDVYNSSTFLTLDLCESRNPCTSARQLAAQNEAHSASSHVMHILCFKWLAVSFIRIM